MIIFEVKKLTSIAIKAPTPNQKTKKPTVIISQIKNIPDAILDLIQNAIEQYN